MTLEGLVVWLLVGLIAGWLAGLVMKGGGYGVVGDIIIGIIGARGRSPQVPSPSINTTSSSVVQAGSRSGFIATYPPTLTPPHAHSGRAAPFLPGSRDGHVLRGCRRQSR